MKRILIAVAAGLMAGAIAASHARLPAAPPKTDAEKAVEATKAAAAKAQDADQLTKAQDKAVANYKRNAASMDRKK
jgi:hypothetical protein